MAPIIHFTILFRGKIRFIVICLQNKTIGKITFTITHRFVNWLQVVLKKYFVQKKLLYKTNNRKIHFTLTTILLFGNIQ